METYKVAGLRHALKLFFNGLKEGYPLCCILSFIKEFPDESQEVWDRRNFAYMSQEHVRCKKCFSKGVYL